MNSMHPRQLASYRFVLFSALLLIGEWAAHAQEKVEFNRDIRPILSDNCFFCHGPDGGHREADLRLDLREEAVSRNAIVPAKPDESVLLQRILSTNPDEVMPPPDSKKKLTAAQKELIKRWIAQGAEYQKHWSYEKPVKAEIPAGQNGIDVLVQRRLKEIGLSSSPEADRRTLIRRVYADVLGLPPSPKVVADFVADTAPNAYEKMVDQALANPHYGERMAIPWLDVVRFADTIGYHSDNGRNVWPYRDWVIKSFNDNKPFDRFTIEQIAGDLLPDANRDTRVGSAFNLLILSTEEGGAQAKDYEVRMMTDRVRAIGAVWLGQTTGCGQCHDHKFDPFTMRDFYSLGAFFADIQEPILGRRADGMIVASPEEEARLAQLDALASEAKKKYESVASQLDLAQKQWEADVVQYNVTLPELKEGAKAAPAIKQLATQAAAALKKETSTRSANEQTALRNYYRGHATRLFLEERSAASKTKGDRDAFYDGLAKCLVSVSAAQPRTVRILPRGNWMDESGEVVKASLPHYLPTPKIEGRVPNRLDLAQWLVSRENPLTARTVMNRVWKQFFGIGLSKVLDDLGAQGEPPYHPALLDWLAVEFMDSGWNMKHMVKTILMSQTYRQVSTAHADLLAKDPDNRLLARQTPFRLDAELVRDHALSVSGLLVDKIGGRSVKPYQPEGYWENLNFPVRTYANDQGDDQYRRGLYTWWQRSFLHPSMLAFDAPSREECCADRSRSNIPQQALVLLNDPTYVEAARVFAAKALIECQGRDEERIRWIWQQGLQRDPHEEELKVALELLAKHRAAYKAAPESAKQLLKIGLAPVPPNLAAEDIAAWTHLTRVVLNLHEFVTRS